MDSTVLLLTSVPDATSDLFVGRHPGADVFRLNVDRLRDFSIHWSPDHWTIEDPVGRVISSESIRSFYWRKPFTELPSPQASEQEYDRQTRRAFAFGLADHAMMQGAWWLVDHRSDQRLSKFRQLVSATDHFLVPETRFVREEPRPYEAGWITKPVGPALVGESKAVATRRIPDGVELDGNYLWLIQREVPSMADVTVVSVCGEHRAFRLDRSTLTTEGGVDWRVDHADPWSMSSWEPIVLDAHVAAGLDRLITSFGIRFARTDFLEDHDGRLWFLEVNPNGQFAWLDLNGDRGVLDLVFNAAVEPPEAWLA